MLRLVFVCLALAIPAQAATYFEFHGSELGRCTHNFGGSCGFSKAPIITGGFIVDEAITGPLAGRRIYFQGAHSEPVDDPGYELMPTDALTWRVPEIFFNATDMLLSLMALSFDDIGAVTQWNMFIRREARSEILDIGRAEDAPFWVARREIGGRVFPHGKAGHLRIVDTPPPAAPIPLPAAGWLLAAGLGVVGICARRKRIG